LKGALTIVLGVGVVVFRAELDASVVGGLAPELPLKWACFNTFLGHVVGELTVGRALVDAFVGVYVCVHERVGWTYAYAAICNVICKKSVRFASWNTFSKPSLKVGIVSSWAFTYTIS